MGLSDSALSRIFSVIGISKAWMLGKLKLNG
jgi:hypothetical protein